MSKADIKKELTELGVWDKYLERREILTKSGFTPKEAAAQAYEEIRQVQPVERPRPAAPAKKDPYGELASIAPQGSCSEREAANFVFEHAAVPVEKIDPSAVPSKGAVGLLKWVQSSPSNAASFYSQIWAKLMPTKSQLDAEARFSDDGKEELEIISRLEESFEPEEKPVQVPSVQSSATREGVQLAQKT